MMIISNYEQKKTRYDHLKHPNPNKNIKGVSDLIPKQARLLFFLKKRTRY